MRISDWSSDVCSSDLGTANSQILVAVQIETAEGLANVEAIAAVDGIDVIFVGPADLAVSLGVFREVFGSAVGAAGKTRLDEIGSAHVELQSLMRISYAVFCMKKKTIKNTINLNL